MIAIDLNKQPDSDLKAIQQVHFTGGQEQNGNTKMFFIIEEAKKIILDFSQGARRL